MNHLDKSSEKLPIFKVNKPITKRKINKRETILISKYEHPMYIIGSLVYIIRVGSCYKQILLQLRMYEKLVY